MVIKQGEWVLEKRISIGTAVLMLAQTVALIIAGSWWIADLDGRVEANSLTISATKAEVARIHDLQTNVVIDAARLDERLRSFDAQLQRFDTLLGRIAAKQNPLP